MTDFRRVVEVLRGKGMSISDTFERAFTGGTVPEDGPEWFDAEWVRKGPNVNLRGPLGFWSLGQFGSGIQIGVAGGRDGTVVDRLHMGGFEGAWYGELPLTDGLDPAVHELDEDDLEDAFQAMDDADYPMLAVSTVATEGEPLRPWECVRPLYFNHGSFESPAKRNRYQLAMSGALASLSASPHLGSFDVFQESSWLELRRLGEEGAAPRGDWMLVVEENILICRSLAGADAAAMSDQLGNCQKISELLGYHWLTHWIDSALAQGSV